MTGWTVIGGLGTDGLAWLPNGNPYGVSTPFGNYFLDLTGYANRPPFFGVSQTISTALGQAYMLTLDLGVVPGDPYNHGPIMVEVHAGSVMQTLTDNPSGSGNIWTPVDLYFEANSTSTTISIQGTLGNGYIGLDNVSVTTVGAVPEPGSLTLGMIGTTLATVCSWLRGRNGNLRGPWGTI